MMTQLLTHGWRHTHGLPDDKGSGKTVRIMVGLGSVYKCEALIFHNETIKKNKIEDILLNHRIVKCLPVFEGHL